MATKCASQRKFFVVVLLQSGWEFLKILVCVRKLTYPATLEPKMILIYLSVLEILLMKYWQAHREVLRAGRFMKINKHHLQSTRIYPVKLRLEIHSHLGGIQKQRIFSAMHTLLPYSSELGGNFQTTFYMVDVGRLKILFFNFHKPTCPRDFSVIIKLLAQIF